MWVCHRRKRDELDIVIGAGLHRARCVEDDRVPSMIVVDTMPEVIDWHERELLSDAWAAMRDERTWLQLANFFELAASDDGFDLEAPGRTFDVVLLDIDHTPHHLLHPDHAPFYSLEGLRRLKAHLRTDGVFALWSDDPPDAEFCALLEQVFDQADAHVVTFANFLTGGESSNTVYVAR